MRFDYTKRISGIMFLGMFFFSAVSMASVGVIWVVQEYNQFKKESERLRVEYVEKQKHLIRSEVQKAVGLVEDRIRQTETLLKEGLQERVYDSHKLTTRLYQQFRQSTPDKELKRHIIEFLRIPRDKGRGCDNFIIDRNGMIQLSAARPEMEGKTLSGGQGPIDQKRFREMATAAKDDREGFFQFFCTAAAREDRHKKMVFVKYFEPFDWFIGSGKYLDDVKNEVQDDALKILAQYRFGKNGYLFGSTYKGEPLFTNGKVTKGTNSIWDLTDANGVQIIQEQREAVRKADGGFYRYSWRKLDSPKLSPKLSFSKGIPSWEWMVGAGVYMDEIDGTIAILREGLNSRIRSQFINITIVFTLLVLIAYLAARYISARTDRAIDRFLAFFKKASTDYVQIDSSDMVFTEFTELADLTNRVVRDREASKKALSISEARWRSLTETSPDQILTLDREMNIQYANCAFPGLTVDEMVGSPLYEYVKGAEKQAEVKAVLKYVLQTGEQGRYETEHSTPEGERVFYESQVAPRRLDSATKIIGLTISSRDITDHKQAEEQIKASLREKGTLLQEIHHRVKNNLAVISGLLNIQADGTKDERLKEALKDSQNRVHSMSTLHEILYQSENLSAINMNEYITRLAIAMSQSFTMGQQIGLKIEAENIALGVEQASPLGLIVNELISNSYKYAFPGSEEGEIRIHLRKEEPDVVTLVYRDNGVGIPEGIDLENPKSMGLSLIKILVEGQLRGSLELKSDGGTCFTINFKLRKNNKQAES